MDDMLPPIAKIEEYGDCCHLLCDGVDAANGNTIHSKQPPVSLCPSGLMRRQSLQASLEDLVSNFDAVISEAFGSEEKIDTFSPLSDSYDTSTINGNQVWLSLTGGIGKTVNIDWRTFQSFAAFKTAITVPDEQDVDNGNLDLPDDEELAAAMDVHSLVTIGILPTDQEPVPSADDVIQEIDSMMMDSDDDGVLDFVGNDDDLCGIICQPSPNWINDIQRMSVRELNSTIEELEDSIRNLSSLLVRKLAEREDLEYEKEQRDLFVKLLHEIESKHKSSESKQKSKKLIDLTFKDDCYSKPKRSNSWRSIFSHNHKSDSSSGSSILSPTNKMSLSSDNLNKNIGVSIPIHRWTKLDRRTIILFNRMLQAMFVNTVHFNQLLTEYILNIYAPVECGILDII